MMNSIINNLINGINNYIMYCFKYYVFIVRSWKDLNGDEVHMCFLLNKKYVKAIRNGSEDTSRYDYSKHIMLEYDIHKNVKYIVLFCNDRVRYSFEDNSLEILKSE